MKPASFCWEDAGRGLDCFMENLSPPNNQELQNHGTRSLSIVGKDMRDQIGLFLQQMLMKPKTDGGLERQLSG